MAWQFLKFATYIYTSVRAHHTHIRQFRSAEYLHSTLAMNTCLFETHLGAGPLQMDWGRFKMVGFGLKSNGSFVIELWERKNQPLDLRLMARLVRVELILAMVAI